MKNGAEKTEELFRKYGDEVLRTCMLILRNRALAEDAAMSAYEKAFSAFHGFRGQSSEKTWLIRIAVNECRNILKSSAYRTRAGEIPETVSDRDVYAEAETKAAVSGAVMSLPEIYREAAVLCLYNGFTLKEAARLAGVSQSAMTFRVGKAKELLKKALEECL
ncbi:MAG: sigma-70 family RNA polymerase sigma factor [Ruminococcus sp.]|nr:sigma-70 family RNA polymerase sigma factor [Ruminococcus sp.]MCM1381517.1 sigma-70 family RNA polymerase sigma factor [Muribaculaceae bacterium]MCM1479270.1 sigma-70 family RNA polymerase sigma factor [Muribaculaceae bacterium]